MKYHFENNQLLAAGIFHRREVPIAAVKEHLRKMGIETR